jgi:hypothetical protein
MGHCHAADSACVSEDSVTPGAPVAGDRVEIIDLLSEARVTAVVESTHQGNYVLRFARGAVIPDEARVRWYDGNAAWQALSQVERIDETRSSFVLAVVRDWEPAPIRRSLRAPVDSSPILVKILTSAVLPHDLRIHAICVDISDSGCRAKWPGLAPKIGDSVAVAWDIGEWSAEEESVWVPAHVVRVAGLPFGARQVGFTFETADAVQAARVRAWRQVWLQEQRQRLRDTRAA